MSRSHMYELTFMSEGGGIWVTAAKPETAGHDCNHSTFLTFYSRVCDDRTRLAGTRPFPDANQRVLVAQRNQSMSTAHQSWIWTWRICNIKKCKATTHPWFAEMYTTNIYSGSLVCVKFQIYWIIVCSAQSCHSVARYNGLTYKM